MTIDDILKQNPDITGVVVEVRKEDNHLIYSVELQRKYQDDSNCWSGWCASMENAIDEVYRELSEELSDDLPT